MLGLLQVQEVLAYVEERNLLPPMVVLQALAKNPHLTLAVVKGYIERQLTQVRWNVRNVVLAPLKTLPGGSACSCIPGYRRSLMSALLRRLPARSMLTRQPLLGSSPRPRP